MNSKRRRSTHIPTEAEKRVDRAMYQGVVFGVLAFVLVAGVYILIRGL